MIHKSQNVAHIQNYGDMIRKIIKSNSHKFNIIKSVNKLLMFFAKNKKTLKGIKNVQNF